MLNRMTPEVRPVGRVQLDDGVRLQFAKWLRKRYCLKLIVDDRRRTEYGRTTDKRASKRYSVLTVRRAKPNGTGLTMSQLL